MPLTHSSRTRNKVELPDVELEVPSHSFYSESPDSMESPKPQQPNGANDSNGGNGSNGSGVAKRPHKRTFQTLVASSKMRHLKKRDGEPLWRTDIQYDFLHEIFFNQQQVFTNPYTKEPGQTFADIYIDAMARSSKCSKILGEKLVGDRAAARCIAMVCLLVNIGRMNTTLNFFPEMKAQLRTYHPIPSLQSHDTADYKQLQDAPRLKSILKGAVEDRAEPVVLSQLQDLECPPTNPINLVFLMSSHAHEVSQLLEGDVGFFDLIMDRSKSSKSRGRTFLWLVWAYLQTKLTAAELRKNPFGYSESRPAPLVKLTEEETRSENIDPPAEIFFGNQMTLQRLSYLGNSSYEPEAKKEGWQPPADAKGPFLTTSHIVGGVVNLVGPNGMPRPKTAHSRKVNDEFEKLMVEKRTRRRKLRRSRPASSVASTWSKIQDLDVLYNSDTDTGLSLRKPGTILPGVIAAGIGNPYSENKAGDYGESSIASAATLRRAYAHVRDKKPI